MLTPVQPSCLKSLHIQKPKRLLVPKLPVLKQHIYLSERLAARSVLMPNLAERLFAYADSV